MNTEIVVPVDVDRIIDRESTCLFSVKNSNNKRIVRTLIFNVGRVAGPDPESSRIVVA